MHETELWTPAGPAKPAVDMGTFLPLIVIFFFMLMPVFFLLFHPGREEREEIDVILRRF